MTSATAVPKVLYLLHHAPVYTPGGVGTYAEELYRGVRAAGGYDPYIVSRVGPPQVTAFTPHPGTRLALTGEDPHSYHLYTDRREFVGHGTALALERLHWSTTDKQLITRAWRALLTEVDPDLVHLHHLTLIGYDLIRETRASLPGVPIVYTLHDFVPICLHDGQMVRNTPARELCDGASPRRCHQCFPAIEPQTFFLRERFVKSAMELVDVFIAPSEWVRQRYVEWGLPADRVIHEPYGHHPVTRLADPPDAGRRRRLGFFGRLTWSKGVDVLLDALALLGQDAADVELVIHGVWPAGGSDGRREAAERRFADLGGTVRFAGSYTPGQLPALMSAVDWVVVPSLWAEVGPIVIAEARAHRRPVICSGVGSMAERVRDGVDGLHFALGDHHSLARVIRRAVNEPGLWDRCRTQITDPNPMSEHLRFISALYEGLTEPGADAVAQPGPAAPR